MTHCVSTREEGESTSAEGEAELARARKKSNLAAARARMYHDLVFDCAERVFAEEGFEESTMQDLAAEAGISLKTLYATFAGKDDIYREILRVRGGGLLEATQSASAQGTPIERLRHGVRAIVAYLVEHRPFFRILLQEGQAWGLHPRGEAARDAWRAGLDATIAIIVDGQREGLFQPGDPELLASTVNAVLQIQLAGLLERTEEPDAEALADQVVVPMLRLLGVAVAPAANRESA